MIEIIEDFWVNPEEVVTIKISKHTTGRDERTVARVDVYLKGIEEPHHCRFIESAGSKTAEEAVAEARACAENAVEKLNAALGVFDPSYAFPESVRV